MKQTVLFFILMGFCIHARSQGWTGFRSPQAAGLGSIGAMENDIWAVYGNPAGLARHPATVVGAGVSNRFLMKEFSNKGLAFASRVPGGVMAVAGSYFGDASYSEQRYDLAFAKQLSDGFWSGITLDYCRLTQGGGYGGAGVFTFSAGLLTRLNQQVYLGAYVFNPLQAKAGGQVKAEIPALMRLGLGYIFSPDLRIVAEIEKAINQKAGLNVGAEYLALQKVYIRAGVNTLPGSWSFGIGLPMGRLRFDVATEMHPTLGLCPQAALSYVLKPY
jgi:hypothetical protein